MACFPVPLASQGFGIGILNRPADKRKTIPIAILMPNKRNKRLQEMPEILFSQRHLRPVGKGEFQFQARPQRFDDRRRSELRRGPANCENAGWG
jgi:hypothetical protein